jgi:hypothetical protein
MKYECGIESYLEAKPHNSTTLEIDSHIRSLQLQQIPLFFLTFSNMITITATFPSEEYIDILATRKGYQDTIMTPREKEESFDAYT